MYARPGPIGGDELVEDREGEPGADDAEHGHGAPTGPRPGADGRPAGDRGRQQQDRARDRSPRRRSPIGGRPASRCLARRPPIAYPSPASSTARPPSSCVAGAAEVDAEQHRDADDADHDAPAGASRSSRSSWSTRIASSAVKIGAEATRIPASDEEISVSPAEISRKGPAIWTEPDQRDAAGDARQKPASAPRRQANATQDRPPRARPGRRRPSRARGRARRS